MDGVTQKVFLRYARTLKKESRKWLIISGIVGITRPNTEIFIKEEVARRTNPEGKKMTLNELFEVLKLPSVSSLIKLKPDMLACANLVVEHIKSIGFVDVRLLETEGNPAVFAQWLGQPGAPTLLIYGHYDVQPVDPVELWETDPFEPLIKNNKIIARGTADAKGQLF